MPRADAERAIPGTSAVLPGHLEAPAPPLEIGPLRFAPAEGRREVLAAGLGQVTPRGAFRELGRQAEEAIVLAEEADLVGAKERLELRRGLGSRFEATDLPADPDTKLHGALLEVGADLR